jgi:drug/metabolite transporter (DMT)-like permease
MGHSRDPGHDRSMTTSRPLVFAVLAGAAMATYTVFSRLASSQIHPVLGAAVITGAAFAVNLIVLVVTRVVGETLFLSARGVGLLLVVGAAAACADLFTLSAYHSGLKVTSSFVISGTMTVLVLLAGFIVLREPFSFTKLAAILLIAAGVFLLQREGL